MARFYWAHAARRTPVLYLAAVFTALVIFNLVRLVSWGVGHCDSTTPGAIPQLFPGEVTATEENYSQEAHSNPVFFTVACSSSMDDVRNLVGHFPASLPPLFIVFGTDLTFQDRSEIMFWKRAMVEDLAITLGSPLNGTDMTRNRVARRMLMRSVCVKFGSCIYVSPTVRFHHAATLNSIKMNLPVQQGISVINSTMNDTVLEGFSFPSNVYNELITQYLKDYNFGKELGKDLHVTKYDEFIGKPKLAHLKYFCYLSIRHELLEQFDKPTMNHTLLNGDDVVRIAVGVPTTGRGLKSFHHSSLFEAFFPSFLPSIQNSPSNYEFHVYIGYDAGDTIWDVPAMSHQVGAFISTKFQPSFNVHIHFVRVPFTKGWLTFIWNYLYARSLSDGCRYFYQANDDLQFESVGWAERFVDALKKNQDYGVVGPNDPKWSCKLLTQAMVSYRHWMIFGYLYPHEIKDWYSDFYLSKVYGDQHTFCWKDIIAKNLQNKGIRYNWCNFPKWNEALWRDKKVLATSK